MTEKRGQLVGDLPKGRGVLQIFIGDAKVMLSLRRKFD